MNSFRSTRRRMMDFRRGVSYARTFLHNRITTSDAVAAVRARLSSRADTFLDAVEQTIFAHVGSPYRPLLDAAGYAWPARMSLLMHPRLGPVDEGALLDCVAPTFTECCHACARVWKEVGTLRVQRAAPITRGGKLMPLHHLGHDLHPDFVPLDLTPSLAGPV